jgi:thiamine pyrophosphokinase
VLAVVLAGGELALDERTHSVAREAGLVIAADGGLRHAWELGCGVDVVVGDFDSVTSPSGPEAPEVLAFPRAKDLTDTHLALREARRRGATSVVLLAAMRGPRLDHGIANVSLLFARELASLDVRALDGPDELVPVRGSLSISGHPGDLVSLIAFSGRVSGISTEGLLYPLHDGTLRRGETRGVSNELTGAEASVEAARGKLLVVHRNGGDPNRLPSG